MIRVLTGSLCLICGMFVAAQEAPKTPLDKLDPKKVPANLKQKGMPKDVIAVLGERDGRYDSIAFSADGKMLAFAGPDGTIRLYDMTTLRVSGTAPHKEPVCLAFSSSGKTLAAGDSQGNVRLFGINFGKLTPGGQVAAHRGGPTWSVAFDPDGKSLYSGGADKTVKVWDVTKPMPALKHTLTGHDDRVRNLAVSSDGKWLASAGDRDNRIQLYDVADKPKEHTRLTVQGGARAVTFSPDSQTLAAGGMNGDLLTWKLGDKIAEPKTVHDGKGSIVVVAFTPEGDELLGLVKWDKNEDRAFVWKLDGTERYQSKYGMHVEAAALDPGGRHVLLVNETSVFVVRLKE